MQKLVSINNPAGLAFLYLKRVHRILILRNTLKDLSFKSKDLVCILFDIENLYCIRSDNAKFRQIENLIAFMHYILAFCKRLN